MCGMVCQISTQYKTRVRFVMACVWELLVSKLLQIQYGFWNIRLVNLQKLAKVNSSYKSAWTFLSYLLHIAINPGSRVFAITSNVRVTKFLNKQVQVISTAILLLTTLAWKFCKICVSELAPVRICET